MRTKYRFYMSLNRDKYMEYYAGQASCIRVRTEEGPTIQFPASVVKPWITHHGIDGYFQIEFDENHKLIEMKKLR